MSTDLIAEARRLASFAPEKPESVHDVVCAGFNQLAEQLAARTRDFLAAVERNEEKDRRIADLEEQMEMQRRFLTKILESGYVDTPRPDLLVIDISCEITEEEASLVDSILPPVDSA